MSTDARKVNHKFENPVDNLLININEYLNPVSGKKHHMNPKLTMGENLADLDYGVSITDKCVGWEKTEEIILEASKELKN